MENEKIIESANHSQEVTMMMGITQKSPVQEVLREIIERK